MYYDIPACAYKQSYLFPWGGGAQIIFWRGVRPEVWNRTHI